MKSTMLLDLFLSFLQIGCFSVGGGLAALPLIEEQIVSVHHWLTADEFAKLITISEMTPGPIAVNSASFVGARIAGVSGALVATLGCILPSCLIVSILAWLYLKYRGLRLVTSALKGLRPVVVGLIGSAAYSMIQSGWFTPMVLSVGGVDAAAVGLSLVSFFVLRKWKCSPIIVIFGSGCVGLILYLLSLCCSGA